jgi:hypothetical protein
VQQDEAMSDQLTDAETRAELVRLLGSDVGTGIVLKKGRPASITSTVSACPRHVLAEHEKVWEMPIEQVRMFLSYLRHAEQWRKDNPDSDKSFFDHLYNTRGEE